MKGAVRGHRLAISAAVGAATLHVADTPDRHNGSGMGDDGYRYSPWSPKSLLPAGLVAGPPTGQVE